MNAERYVWAVDLDGGVPIRMYYPETLADLSGADIFAPGKCVTIHIDQGVVYIAGASRCAPKLWRIATGSDNNRPNAPWAAFRGLGKDRAQEIVWAWLSEKQLA